MLIMKSTFYIFSHILFALIELSSPQSLLIQEMSSRQTRYHHFLWHNIRENWNRLSSDAQAEIRDLGWAPPNPARRFSGDEPIAITDNFSGEDFLYMHRQMVNRARSLGAPSAWVTIPGPEDSTYPVPPAYTIPGQPSRTEIMSRWKTTSFYESDMLSAERRFTDPFQLRGMTLAEMGARIEVTIHSYMHLRFSSSSSYGYRPSTSDAFPDIDERWDDPSYDWLVDNYSSQVNPIFWRLHGWVDDRIEDWRRANGLSSIRWSGTWDGGPMSSVSNLWAKTSLKGSKQEGEQMEMKDDVMLKVARIIAKEGVESSLADPVLLDIPVKSKSKSISKMKICKTRRNRKNHM